MGLGSEMKNLSEEILASFKQRIMENEELVIEVQKTLDGFRKDHLEMANLLTANAAALRKDLAKSVRERLVNEKERLITHKGFMKGIHVTISSIQKEVEAIQTSATNLITKFSEERDLMAEELNKFFAKGKSDRMKNEKIRMKEFDALMKNITDDIKSINDEVLGIFKNTNGMLAKFEKEHLEMSAELRAELSKNLAERFEYTRALLNGFQKRLSEISKENQQMGQRLRKDLAHGEVERLKDYHGIMKGIQVAIKGIRTEVKNIKSSTSGMLEDLLQNRVEASAEWNNMQKVMAQIRKTGVVTPPKEIKKKAEKKEVKKEIPVKEEKKILTEAIKEAPVKEEKKVQVEAIKETPVKKATPPLPLPSAPMTLEEKVLDYISKHPKGVKISAMEEPLGETRMKLGFVAKHLLDEGKVLKIENIYYPKPKLVK